MSEHLLADKAVGCLAGGAVGDALGGATEGWEASEIHDHFGGFVEGIVESIRRTKKVEKAFSPFHKGDGHVTDDTLMTRALVNAYEIKRDHLDAYDVEALLVPEIVDKATWIPELNREDLLYHRLFLAEKWLVLKLRYGHADPRDAGIGNIVNCGAAMYIAPVGIANAGDPDGAYLEALDLSGAHQSSYGREAAGVLAAAVAESLRPEATVTSVVE
ncbi:MAG TPA: ADP-ribosylglycohydrolase family protein, partial [Gaiellaceae bacterium]|nr:ADP-ribosylglycohydrolase family protein [Gaiellaceae bacterium]